MLRQEIEAAMAELRRDASGSLTARFVFPAVFTGFAGHFPGNPVLPGVCLVQCALAMLRKTTGAGVRLQRIENAKFFATVAPGDILEFVCREQRSESAPALVRATVSSTGRKIAELRLCVAYGGGGRA
jgi:3-hydroxyacyl-[acyl-carrier-protein] dehydratase